MRTLAYCKVTLASIVLFFPKALLVLNWTFLKKSIVTLTSIVSGGKLDTLARAPLWQSGLEYRHGTGHGVGAFLNVHEGPHGISFRDSAFQVALKPGMIVTNEPGTYTRVSLLVVLLTVQIRLLRGRQVWSAY